MISSIKIKGFRGFVEEQELKLSIPNGKRGSGLTVMVGPNNGGKSTVIESFRAICSKSDRSFMEGKRNKKAGDRVEIVLFHDDGKEECLKTVSNGGSEAKYDRKTVTNPHPSIYILPSRRYFNPFFNKSAGGREAFILSSSTLQYRGQPIDDFKDRLFNAIREKDKFNRLLSRVIGKKLDWTIDQDNTGNYYVKIILNDGYHDSDGLGEGLVSLLFLIDSLFESSKNELIVIDEPELSLHPQLQRNLLDEILDYSKDIQILYATHSPEMVSIKAILNGGTLCRIVNEGNGSKIYQLNDVGRDCLKKFEGNLYNPHVLGYDARSCFFEADRLVVVEGQEDVMFLNKALDDLHIEKRIRFFGFGAGGAGNIEYIATILKSLGFENICCLYDGDKESELEKTKELFPQYEFKLLDADDIRDKECDIRNKCRNIKDEDECRICKHRKAGIFNKDNDIKPEFKTGFECLLHEIAEKYGY